MSEKYQVPPNKIMEVIDFQDFKRMYRGGKANYDLSTRVVERYMRMEYKK